MITDLFESGWTVKKNTESVDSGGAVTDTWSTDTTIGTSGVISAHIRQLSRDEVISEGRPEVVATHRVYTAVDSITEKHRLVSPDGEVFNVVAVDNPHELDEFLQIDVRRSEVEAEDDS